MACFHKQRLYYRTCILRRMYFLLRLPCRPSFFRRNGLWLQTVCCLAWGGVICVSFLVLVYYITKSQLHSMDSASIQQHKCPACFGLWENVCLAFASEELKVWGDYFWRQESVKGVRYGVWNKLPVVVKMLGHRKELDLLDVEICQNVSLSSHCNVEEIVWRSFLNPRLSFKSSVMQFMECPSNQFANLLQKHLSNDMEVVQLHQKVMAMTNLYFNQEFLFLQIFSKTYPEFLPHTYGACGRAVVVEYVGPTLSSALFQSWLERVKLSLKLIQLARSFTRTVDDLALYMYDVTMDNFAIDDHGNVKLIDCEHVLIVDMSNFNNTYVINAEDLCSPDHFECLTFVPEDLCKGQSQDHNYYVVCRNLLAGIGGTKGLLHSPPHQLVNISLINYLQHNCVYREQISREQAINQLEKELQTYVKRNDGNT